MRPVDKFGNVESILSQVSTARVPRYLVKSLQQYPESHRYDANKDSRVKVIGFGERFTGRESCDFNSGFHYQAPELVLFSQLSPCVDIWSLGCLVCSPVLLTSSMSTDATQRSTN